MDSKASYLIQIKNPEQPPSSDGRGGDKIKPRGPRSSRDGTDRASSSISRTRIDRARVSLEPSGAPRPIVRSIHHPRVNNPEQGCRRRGLHPVSTKTFSGAVCARELLMRCVFLAQNMVESRARAHAHGRMGAGAIYMARPDRVLMSAQGRAPARASVRRRERKICGPVWYSSNS